MAQDLTTLTLKPEIGLARVGVFAFGTFVLATDGFVIAGILPQIAQGMGVSLPLAGQLVTLFALTYALGTPLLALASARLDRRRFLLGALGTFALANLIAAIASDYWILAAARVIAALSAASYTPTATLAAASLVSPEKRGRALAIVTGGMTLAILFGVPFGILIGGAFGWRATFGLIAILTVIAALALAVWLPALPALPVISLRARLVLLTNRQIAGLLLVSVLALTGGFSVYTYLLPLLAHVHPSAMQISLLFAAFGAGGLVGNALGGFSVDRFGASRTAGSSLVSLSVILATFAVSPRTFLGSLGLLFVWGIAGWAMTPAQQHRILTRAGHAAQAAVALNGSSIYLGIALSAAAGGFLLNHGGVVVLPLVAAGIVAVGFLVSIYVDKKSREILG